MGQRIYGCGRGFLFSAWRDLLSWLQLLVVLIKALPGTINAILNAGRELLKEDKGVIQN
jgi:hypothetical protein